MRFNRPSTCPFGVSRERVIDLLEKAVESGAPDFDPWDKLPPGADA
jgi:hypothetical protein